MTHAAPPAARGTAAGYLVYVLLLALPFAYRQHDYNTLYILELRRAVLWGGLALGGGLVLAFAPRLWRRRHPLHRPLLAFLAGCALSTIGSRLPALSAEVLAYLAVGGLLFYIAALVMDLDADLPRLERAVGIGGVLVAVYSLVQHWGANPLALVNEGELQCSATFATRNLMATYLAFALVLAVDRLLAAPRATAVAGWALAVGTIAVALALSLTVGAWIAATVAIAAQLALRAAVARRGGPPVPVHRLGALAIVAVLAAGGAVHVAVNKPEHRRLAAVEKLVELASGQHESVRQREVMIGIAWRIFSVNVAKGAGPGTFDLARGRFEHEYFEQPRYWPLSGLSPYPHNDPLQVAAEMGLVGAIPYLWLALAFLVLPWRLLAGSDATRAHLARTAGWWCGALAIQIHGLVHFSLSAPAAAFCWFLALGVCAAGDVRFGRKPLIAGRRKLLAVRVGAALAGIALAIYFACHYAACLAQETGLTARLSAAAAIPAFESARDTARELERSGNMDAARRAGDGALAIADASRVDLELAVNSYRSAIQLRPWSQSLWQQVGGLERLRGYPEEARRAYLRGLRYAPDDYQLHQAMAELLLADNQTDEARRYARQAIELRPNAVQAHVLLGQADLGLRHFDSAHEHFARARHANDRHAGGYLYAAIAYGMAGQGGRGITLLVQGAERVEDPRDRNALLMLAVLLFRQVGAHDQGARLAELLRRVGGASVAPGLDDVVAHGVAAERARIGQLMVCELERLVGDIGPAVAGDAGLAARIAPHAAHTRAALTDSLARWGAGDAAAGERAANDAASGCTAIEAELDGALRTLEDERRAGRPIDQGLRLLIVTQRDLARALRGAIATGPLVGKTPDEAIAWRDELVRRLGRIFGLSRAERRVAGLVGPLYMAELYHLGQLLAPSDAALAERPEGRERVVSDDIRWLAAEGALVAGAFDDAAQRLDALAARGGLRRTLVPPWAMSSFDGAGDPARVYFARRTPDTANLAMVARAELELYAGRPRAALARAIETASHCARVGEELDSRTWVLPDGWESFPPAGRELVLAAHRFAVDRLATEVALLAALECGDTDAERTAAARLDAGSARLPFQRLRATPAGRGALRAALWAAMESR